MAISSKARQPDNFESHNSLKLSFTNIWGLCSNFVDCESFLESTLLTFLLYERQTWMTITHVHGLTVYVKEGLPFAQELSLENSADSYLFFWLILLHSVSYIFFLYQSPSLFLCLVFDCISSNIDDILLIIFGDFTIHHKGKHTYSSGTTSLRWLTFLLGSLTLIVTVLLLDIFLSSDTSICSAMAFPPLGNADHVVASGFIDFPSYLQWDALIHHIVYDYFCFDWDGLCNHLWDVLWEDIFKLSASAAPNEFYEWVQVGTDIYISHQKYQIKPHSST